MITSYLRQLETPAIISPDHFMDTILELIYPLLCMQVNTLQLKTSLLPEDGNGNAAIQLLATISSEMDQLFLKEKLVLFPLLAELSKVNKKTETCDPFKSVKHHYTRLLKAIKTLQGVFTQSFAMQCRLLVSDIEKELAALLKYIVQLQQAKDKYLYPRFKSCTGCKAMVTDNGK